MKILYFKQIDCYQNRIMVDTLAFNGSAVIRFFVDLKENNLLMDPNYTVYKPTTDIQINEEIDYWSLALMHDYIKNGSIGVYSPDGELLATSTPYMPNIVQGRSIGDLAQQIEEKKKKLEGSNQAF